jgi:predicted alpha/beta superfamily hydrolase
MRRICWYASSIVVILVSISVATARQATDQLPYQAATLGSTHVRNVRSSILSRDFKIYMSLPWGYGSTQKRYPAVYLTDADSGFGLAHVASLNLQGDQEIPETIVVGIGYGLDLSRDLSAWVARRTRELTPTAMKDRAGSGEASQFARFVREELVPFIENNYRTDPGDRTLAGGSFGGLFALYMMLQSPNSFGQYIARSPSLYWDDRFLFKLERDYAAKHRDLPVTLFTSVGTAETDRMRSDWADFVKVLRGRQFSGFRLVVATMPEARHNAAIGMAFYAGLKAVLGATVDDSALDQYVGRYTVPQGTLLSIARGEQGLLVDWNGERGLRVLARSPRRFSFAAGQGDAASEARSLERLEFRQDTGGDISQVVIHKNGQSVIATRVK